MKQDRNKLILTISKTILKEEFQKGHLKWNIRIIAKKYKVSRALIYYYFGRTKKCILKEAYRQMLGKIFSTTQIDSKWPNHQENNIDKMPHLFVLYYLQKDKDSEIGKMIRDKEKQFLSTLKFNIPNLTDGKILRQYLLKLGKIVYQGYGK